jgi:hypothetical protein
MTLFFAALWGRASGWLAAVGVAFAIVAGAFFYGRSDGKSDAEAERAKADAKAVKQAKGVEDEIQNMGGTDVDAALSKWMRDGKR